MKKIAQTCLLILMPLVLHGQDINGQWNGSLDVQGTQLRLIFHVIKKDNKYEATMDSPDQNAKGIPVTVVTFNYPDVKFEMSGIGAVYVGTLHDNRITGKWIQSGQTMSLNLLKADDTIEDNK